MDTYIQGESIQLNIPVTNAGGDALDLSEVDAIKVEVYHKDNRTTLKTGTYAGGEVTSDDLTLGVVIIHIEDGLTDDATTGEYKYVVTITQTDTDFDDSVNTSKAKNDAFEITRR